MMRRMLIVAAWLLLGAVADAGWWEAYQADGDFDLQRARRLALTAVADLAEDAEGVAAAWWWLDHLDILIDPSEILSVAAEPRDPELALVLYRIAAELEQRPPLGALVPAEVAGPFGAHPVLDLDRAVVPGDHELPTLPTPWSSPGRPYRLSLRSANGRAAPPELLFSPGVYLAAWTLLLQEPTDGWMVVEAHGGFNLEVNGQAVDRRRDCGRSAPVVSWYAWRAGAGSHRIRAEIAARSRPDIRISLLDRSGRPMTLHLAEHGGGPWAAATITPSSPPAAAALFERLEEGGGSVAEHLLAATLAQGRDDPRQQLRWIRRAGAISEEDPWLHLAEARVLISQPTGVDTTVAARRARDHLRAARSIPLAQLFERALAVRQKRVEDQERILGELLENHPEDPRVLRLWVREAVRRGWVREAEESMSLLQTALPESPTVLNLRLAVLEALERWPERNALLLSLAGEPGAAGRWIDELAGGCFATQAVVGLRQMAEVVDDPMVDLGIVRLLLEAENLEEAETELAAARARWGELDAIETLGLVIASARGRSLREVLAGTLEHEPANLDLRALAWRSGDEPFFEPFRVDALAIADRATRVAEGVDAEVLLDQAVEQLFVDGSSLYYYHGLTRTHTPEGARQASTLQQLPNALLLKVRIIRPDGTVIIPPEVGSRNGNIVLSGVKEGDMVEEEYVAGLAPTLPGLRGHLSPYVYRFADPDRAFTSSEYVLLYPPEIDLLVEGRFEGLQREEWETGGQHAIRWWAEGVAPVPAEPLAPPTQELLPWVTYGFGLSWEQVGDSLRDRVLQILRTSPELETWGDAVLAAEDPETAVKLLINGLVDEVEAGRSDLELGVTAGESFSLRRGNRLAIAAALLIRAGWQVDLVLARPIPFAGTHVQVPSMDAFSLPVLRVVKNDRELWLDLGEERGGVDHIAPILQGSDALLLPLAAPHESSRLFSPLPRFANPELEEHIVVRAVVAVDGSASIHFETVLRGVQSERILDRLKSVAAENESAVFSQLAANLFAGAEEVVGQVERVENGALLQLDLRLAEACDTDGDELVCHDLLPMKPLVPALASLPQRSFPLVLQLPVTQIFELQLQPPPGWRHNHPARLLQSDWGVVEEEIREEGVKLHSVLRLQLPAQSVSPEAYPGFARFCHAADELVSRPRRLHR